MVYECIYVESRKIVLMNLFARQKQRHRRREWTYGHREEEEVGMNWEIGSDMYTLRCVE